METQTQKGYLVLADISGYTSFMATTELDHAHKIISEFLELIVNRFQPVLTISKLEGDAVFAFAPETKLTRGETLLEIIESTYIAFKDKVEATKRRTVCSCKGCHSATTLDLKFITHYGDYVLRKIAGGNEVIGSDVNLIHRLLKNHVSEATGWRAYALFTETNLKKLGAWPEKMHPGTESYEHLGQVQTFSLNLENRYQELIEKRRVSIGPVEADMGLEYDLPAPPPVIWNWLNDPNKRALWEGAEVSVTLGPGGRMGEGTANHCVVGNDTIIETILDWRPFDYFTVEMSGLPMSFKRTIQLKSTNGGTRLSIYIKLNKSKIFDFLFQPIFKVMMRKEVNKLFKTMEDLIKKETLFQ